MPDIVTDRLLVEALEVRPMVAVADKWRASVGKRGSRKQLGVAERARLGRPRTAARLRDCAICLIRQTAQVD